LLTNALSCAQKLRQARWRTDTGTDTGERTKEGDGMAQKLTQAVLKKLLAEAQAAPEKGRFVFDSEIRGLYVRLRRGGLDFGYSYRLRGREKRLTLGRFGPMTLQAARDRVTGGDGRPGLYTLGRSGEDLIALKDQDRRRRLTFEEVATLYLADLRDRAKRKAGRGKASTIAEFEGLLRRYIIPAFGGKEITSVDRSDVRTLYRGLASTPATANRVLTLVGVVMRFSEQTEPPLRPAGSNPCALIGARERIQERPKRPRFTMEELQKLGEAMREAERTESENPSVLLAVRLLAFSGCRLSEILAHTFSKRRPEGGGGLRWRDVDLERRSIHLIDAKTGSRMAPLTAPALAVLRAAPRGSGDDPVCPSSKRKGAALSNLGKNWARLLEAAGLEHRGLHSLRRTFASVAGDLGEGEYSIGFLLGHASSGVTSDYVLLEDGPLRQVAERVAGRIAAALGEPEMAKVLPMGKVGAR
jgi:integrase